MFLFLSTRMCFYLCLSPLQRSGAPEGLAHYPHLLPAVKAALATCCPGKRTVEDAWACLSECFRTQSASIPVFALERKPLTSDSAEPVAFGEASALPPPPPPLRSILRFILEGTLDPFLKGSAAARGPVRVCARKAASLGALQRITSGGYNEAEYLRYWGKQAFDTRMEYRADWKLPREMPIVRVLVYDAGNRTSGRGAFFENLDAITGLLRKYNVPFDVVSEADFQHLPLRTQAKVTASHSILITTPGPHLVLAALMFRRTIQILVEPFGLLHPLAPRQAGAADQFPRVIYSRIKPKNIAPEQRTAWDAAISIGCHDLPVLECAKNPTCAKGFSRVPVVVPLAQLEAELLNAFQLLDDPRMPKQDPLSLLLGLPQDAIDEGSPTTGIYEKRAWRICPRNSTCGLGRRP
jgi:hypothetical protein